MRFAVADAKARSWIARGGVCDELSPAELRDFVSWAPHLASLNHPLTRSLDLVKFIRSLRLLEFNPEHTCAYTSIIVCTILGIPRKQDSAAALGANHFEDIRNELRQWQDESRGKRDDRDTDLMVTILQLIEGYLAVTDLVPVTTPTLQNMSPWNLFYTSRLPFTLWSTGNITKALLWKMLSPKVIEGEWVGIYVDQYDETHLAKSIHVIQRLSMRIAAVVPTDDLIDFDTSSDEDEPADVYLHSENRIQITCVARIDEDESHSGGYIYPSGYLNINSMAEGTDPDEWDDLVRSTFWDGFLTQWGIVGRMNRRGRLWLWRKDWAA